MLAWRNRSRSAAIRPALFTVAVIMVQIELGALTVIAGNGAPTLAAHLLAALAMLAGATITAVAAATMSVATLIG
jgi:heme A synthase